MLAYAVTMVLVRTTTNFVGSLLAVAQNHCAGTDAVMRAMGFHVGQSAHLTLNWFAAAKPLDTHVLRTNPAVETLPVVLVN